MSSAKDRFAPRSDEDVLQLVLAHPLAWIVSGEGTWNRLDYRPLEGFVFAITPFNFTAIRAGIAGPAQRGSVLRCA